MKQSLQNVIIVGCAAIGALMGGVGAADTVRHPEHAEYKQCLGEHRSHVCENAYPEAYKQVLKGEVTGTAMLGAFAGAGVLGFVSAFTLFAVCPSKEQIAEMEMQDIKLAEQAQLKAFRKARKDRADQYEFQDMCVEDFARALREKISNHRCYGSDEWIGFYDMRLYSFIVGRSFEDDVALFINPKTSPAELKRVLNQFRGLKVEGCKQFRGILTDRRRDAIEQILGCRQRIKGVARMEAAESRAHDEKVRKMKKEGQLSEHQKWRRYVHKSNSDAWFEKATSYEAAMLELEGRKPTKAEWEELRARHERSKRH